MLSSDELIYNILINEKNNGNRLLQGFNIKYPDKTVMSESNTIYVAAVSSEPNNELFEGTEYRDLVEILVVTKIRDYQRALKVIKTTIREIISILKNKTNDLPHRPIIRNISPEYNPNFVLNKGHLMVEVLTEIEDDEPDTETYESVCSILLDDNNIETE